MEESEKIKNVGAMTEEKDETVISVYLGIAKDTILNRLYPYVDEAEKRVWLDRYDALQCKIASYMLNKRGAEGETQHTENGIARHYADGDVPREMLNEITPFGRVRKKA